LAPFGDGVQYADASPGVSQLDNALFANDASVEFALVDRFPKNECWCDIPLCPGCINGSSGPSCDGTHCTTNDTLGFAAIAGDFKVGTNRPAMPRTEIGRIMNRVYEPAT
jgi:hypothetical protein